MGRSVQYRDSETLIEAYKESECKAWAVLLGNDILRKGIDENKLSSYLDSLEDSTPVIYTLRGYYDTTELSQINKRTEADFSGNFMFNGDPSHAVSSQYAEINHKNKLFQRLETIEEALIEIKDGKSDQPAQDETLLGKLSGMIKTPQDIRDLVGVIKSIFSNEVVPMNAIGNVHFSNEPKQETKAPDAALIYRLQQAINTLEKHDPHMVDHLEKLAKIAVEKPGEFKLMLSLLDSK